MCVAEMPQGSNQVDTNIRIPGISHIHNIRCKENGMRYWKAYGVGKGGWLERDTIRSVNIPQLKILEDFLTECLNTGVMRTIPNLSSEKNADTIAEDRKGRVEFDCPTDGCVRGYETVAGLQKHLGVGSHVFRFHRESQFDHIKRQYANMVSEELSRPLFNMNCNSKSAPCTEQNI